MLIAFVGLIALCDALLGVVPIAGEPLSLSRLLGWLFVPFALAMGVAPGDCFLVGQLLGEKLVLTEFIAYAHLGRLLEADPEALGRRSAVITSYALCGFANFASIGVQLGGIGGLAPGRTSDLAALSLRAMIGGSLAAFMTACVAGVFVG
jgi:CNT family concentrative nucleoside transporter